MSEMLMALSGIIVLVTISRILRDIANALCRIARKMEEQ